MRTILEAILQWFGTRRRPGWAQLPAEYARTYGRAQ